MIHCTRILSIFFILFSSTSIYAQTPNNADCFGAVHICDGDTIMPNTSVYGIASELEGPTSSVPCLTFIEDYSHWLILTVASSGTLEFSFTSSFSSGNLSWAMWTYDDNACYDIITQASLPVACNKNSFSDGLTGMAASTNLPPFAFSVNFEAPINVVAGEQYIICINRDILEAKLYFESFGTAQLCGTPPNSDCNNVSFINSVTGTYPNCGNECIGTIDITPTNFSGNYQYSLGLDTNNYGQFSNLCSGKHIVFVEDTVGCIQYCTYKLYYNPPPDVPTTNLGLDIPSCEFFCDTIIGQGLMDYQWIVDGNVVSNTNTLNYCDTVPEELLLTGIDCSGCPTDTVEIQFSMIDYALNQVVFNPNVDTILLGQSANLCLGNMNLMLDANWSNGQYSTPCISVSPTTDTEYCAYVFDPCGRTDTLCHTIYVDSSNASLSEISAENFTIQHHPNGFSLDYPSNKAVTLQVFDAMGRLVLKEEDYHSGHMIESNELPMGIYHITTEFSAHKFLKQ